MAADDGHAIGGTARRQALQDRACRLAVPAPQGIDHGDRPSAHGGNVGNIDHDPAIAGEPGFAGDEFIEEALDGEEKVTIAVRNGGAIVADRNRRRPAKAEGFHHGIDIALMAKALGLGQAAGEILDRHQRPRPISTAKPFSPIGEARIMGQIGRHQVMFPAVQGDTLQTLPMQALEQGDVLGLDMGQEPGAAPGHRTRDREADQAAAQGAQAPPGRIDRQPRATPEARPVRGECARCPPPGRARRRWAPAPPGRLHARPPRRGRRRRRSSARGRTPGGAGPGRLPAPRGRWRISPWPRRRHRAARARTAWDHSSKLARAEQAPHLPQPALISSERRPAAFSMAPSGARISRMKAGLGAG